METYRGHVRSAMDALILFEACRLGVLNRIQRRLSAKERSAIRSGSVFVWDEREAGMKRWTDGKSWSASRVNGAFLTYREMEGRKSDTDGGGANGTTTTATNRKSRRTDSPWDAEEDLGNAEGYRYKPDGLIKQSFSVETSDGMKLHLIAYFVRSHVAGNQLLTPATDPQLYNIKIPKGVYPEAVLLAEAQGGSVSSAGPAGATGHPMQRSASLPVNYTGMPPMPPTIHTPISHSHPLAVAQQHRAPQQFPQVFVDSRHTPPDSAGKVPLAAPPGATSAAAAAAAAVAGPIGPMTAIQYVPQTSQSFLVPMPMAQMYTTVPGQVVNQPYYIQIQSVYPPGAPGSSVPMALGPMPVAPMASVAPVAQIGSVATSAASTNTAPQDPKSSATSASPAEQKRENHPSKPMPAKNMPSLEDLLRSTGPSAGSALPPLRIGLPNAHVTNDAKTLDVLNKGFA